MFGLGPSELLIVGVIAVLLFGSRLPSVARSAGRSLTEFKKGMQDVRSDFNHALEDHEASSPKSEDWSTHDRLEPTAPKFEPPQTVA